MIAETARRAGLLLVSLALALAVGEVALRITGFSFDVSPESVEFGWPNPRQLRALYVRDPDLFWVTRGYREKLRQLSARRPDVVLLGDSCTEFGRYGRLLAERLRAGDPAGRATVEALGVGGWTSYQGLQQLARDVLPLRPRVVTFYFGWNDHWIGFGVDDKEIGVLTRSFLGRLSDFRLGQLLFKAELARRVRRRSGWPRRVSDQDFRQNLTEMARRAKAAEAVPVLLTAPSSHEEGKEPAYLVRRWLKDPRELVPLHRQYVSIVREVAEREGAVLCDLAAQFDALPREDVSGRYFELDGIHLTRSGDAKIAEFLTECFRGERRVREALPQLPLWSATVPPP